MSWACMIKRLEILEQIYAHKVQVMSKSQKKKNVRKHSAPNTNCTRLFRHQAVPKSSFPPTQHILQKSEADSAWSRCDGVYTKLYWFHYGRSLKRTFSKTSFSITEPSQLRSSSAIGFSHYTHLMDIHI